MNFRGNDPQWWSWIFDPILFSPEASAFYLPFTADPIVGKTAFTGSESVWRTQNAGGEKDFLENHCSVLGGPRSDRLQHRRRLRVRRLDQARARRCTLTRRR